ncbi:MAG: hypothetical protein WA793_12145, partial [Sphingorhabdus sp.]|uniref:hypothetical protein n=1 Tax=Sphingorhabdus sp. TaxID=1902408 RepID=UPI003C8C4E4B
ACRLFGGSGMNARALPSRTAAFQARQYVRLRTLLPDVCYAILKLCGWITVTASCVVAGFAFFFFLLGNLEFAGFVLQLDNFTSRFLEADHARRAHFETQLGTAALILFITVGFFRRHSLFPLFQPREEKAHG